MASLEGPAPSWLEQFFVTRTYQVGPSELDEFQIYRRVIGTMRSLARAGRAVLVGRGGVYATQDLPGGVHVRLVAPLEARIEHMASLKKLSETEAAEEVSRIEHDREKFYRRFWPGKPLLGETFTITLNTDQIDEERQVECIVPLIKIHASAKGVARPVAHAGA